MAVNSDLSDPGSPSLLSNLKRFEYRKNERGKVVKGITYSDGEQSTDALNSLILTTEEKPVIEEGISNGHIEDEGSLDSPVIGRRSNKRRIASDSENEEKGSNAEKKSCMEDESVQHLLSKEDEFLFTDKERSLRVMMEAFPKVDLTALSAVLEKSNWNEKLALRTFREEEERKKLERVVRNGSMCQTMLKPSTSKRDGTATVVRIVPPGSKIRRKQTHELSDDEGEEKVRLITHSISDSEDDDVVYIGASVPVTSKVNSRTRNRLVIKRSKGKNRRDVEVDSDCEDYAEGESSTDSDDSDIDDTLTPSRAALLELLRDGTAAELSSIPGCSKKKVEAIIQLRPFDGWVDLVRKFQSNKQLSRDLLTKAKDIIYMRDVMKKLMNRCERISLDIEAVMNQFSKDGAKKSYIREQPALLNDKMKLAPYQLIGLNWLYVMHKQQLNGILADEMGLGKTIQAIAFLAYLHDSKETGQHLIVVPSSTLDNWLYEFNLWCPTLNVVYYHGSQDDRKEIRMQVLNDEVDWDVMITTYNMIASSLEDRGLFRRLHFHYVIFDEAHMLKNMSSQRYQNLMRIAAKRRLLLTGTPLQNNLVELMSLLIFVMPGMFHDKIDQVKQMFSAVTKPDEEKSKYEAERIRHAKRIMKPFLLRRLKSEVLQQLPQKHEETVLCALSSSQQEKYDTLVMELTKKVKEERDFKSTGVGMMMMELRKAANHPLLVRRIYTDEKLRKMSKLMLKEPTHYDANPQLIFEDMQVMSDFELHGLCKIYRSVSSFKLEESHILDSGKFQFLDKFWSKWKQSDSRILLFSQFTMMLDVIEEYLRIRRLKFLRLDGSTPVQDRQDLIDRFNGDASIFVFILSTKAGGLGINLTAANVVVIHDIDFNPYNDKQAEDRCHRVGQTRDVHVSRLISKNTIEEGMLQIAREKLRLEKDITTGEGDEEEEIKCVTTLLKQALGM